MKRLRDNRQGLRPSVQALVNVIVVIAAVAWLFPRNGKMMNDLSWTDLVLVFVLFTILAVAIAKSVMVRFRGGRPGDE